MSCKIIPLKKKKYNNLTVVGEPYVNESKRTMVPCECVCGNKIDVDRYALVHGRTKSCGCQRKKYVPKPVKKTKKRVIKKARTTSTNGKAHQEIINLYNSGMTVAEIAVKTRRSKQGVRIILVKNGIKLGRDKGKIKPLHRKPKITMADAMSGLAAAMSGGVGVSDYTKEVVINLSTSNGAELTLSVDTVRDNIETCAKMVYGFLQMVREGK